MPSLPSWEGISIHKTILEQTPYCDESIAQSYLLALLAGARILINGHLLNLDAAPRNLGRHLGTELKPAATQRQGPKQ